MVSFTTNDADLRAEYDSLPKLLEQMSNKHLIEEEKKERKPWEFPEDLDLDKLPEEKKKLWIMRQANMRNGGRPRFFDESRPYDVEECKDENGFWIKWIKERLTPEEAIVFKELKERIKDNPLINWLPDNHLLRFLDGRKFNIEATEKSLIEGE